MFDYKSKKLKDLKKKQIREIEFWNIRKGNYFIIYNFITL